MEEAKTECEAWHETGAVQLGTGHGIVNVSSLAALSPVKFKESFFFFLVAEERKLELMVLGGVLNLLPCQSGPQAKKFENFMWGSDVM